MGVTCCSATLPLLDDLAFDVCLLDEASQIVEPLSLLPLIRAKCRLHTPAKIGKHLLSSLKNTTNLYCLTTLAPSQACSASDLSCSRHPRSNKVFAGVTSSVE